MRVELPPEPVHFVNRDGERDTALRAVDGWYGRNRPLVLSLSGPGGLGKTELAYLLARSLRDRFPDGVLVVDLDDFRLDGVIDPGHALSQLLESLDVPPDMLAASYRAKCKQWWKLTTDARLIVVVDNARYASEVVPLIPASGNSLVIVASHGPLHDLEDGAALDVVLPPLEPPHGRELLGLVARDRRLDEDPEAAEALVRLCDGLPAALLAVGRWLRAHRLRPLPKLVAELGAELDVKGGDGVERVWDTVYAGLSEAAAALYRLLPHHPGPAFTPASATALLGRGPEVCEEALEELVRAGLLDLRAAGGVGPADADGAPGDGRMRLPAPLHAHALRRARDDGAPAEAAEAQIRVLRWFVRQAQRADLYAAGKRLVVTDPYAPLPHAPDVPLRDPAGAVDEAGRTAAATAAARRLHEERHTLAACVRLAHARGLDAEAVALCEPLWTYALDHPHRSDTVDLFRLGADSAVRAGNPRWIARMRCQLARRLWQSGEPAGAAEEMAGAQSAADLLGDAVPDRKLAASVIEFRGMLHSATGDHRAAVADFLRSREIHREIGNDYGAMLQTYRTGEATARLGDPDTAHELLAEAHAEATRLGRARMTARTGFALAGVLRRLGRPAEARPLVLRALEAARERNSAFDEARVLDALADLAADEGDTVGAQEHREAAEAIRRRNGLL
ncbi:tetratricopeptide repeat protein [Streptomyces sp. NPDC005805]|uniref:tetratricopeptide repeat protein n=1 Tax=Streptomyces sp. NPDC005805 TaxID=3157068 RepID=UPI0033C25E33